jgi:class 3 adenylate cyclase
MIHKVRKIAKNPLEAAQEEENQALAFERFMQSEAKKGRVKKKKKDKEAPYETVILENTIVKIGALLAIGFGEAGSNIIAKNMANSNGEVDPMTSGVKCVAFFGFCDIRQFTDTTEILQEEVMVFVNEIGEIVHSCVDSYAGAANKNIGDAFLLVWKCADEDTEYSPEFKNMVAKKTYKSGAMAEMAVTAFVKTFAEINKSRKLNKYRSYEKLNFRMPNYSVKMGFGLHVGWAIEGAIGSDFKIDVSYLSPSVKLSDELEASTKLFGTPLLMSGSVHELMSDELKAKCRQVDTVKIPGSSGKFQLFTCDLDFNLVDLEEMPKRVLTPMEIKLKRVKARLKRDREKKKVYEGSIKIVNKFELDEDITKMREPFTPEFYEQFNAGFKDYLEGNWDDAKQKLDKMEEIRGTPDGPSLSLLTVMQEHNYRAPADWEGWRDLD